MNLLDPMIEIVNRITQIASLDELSAEELAALINFMIDHETQPGGPYVFEECYDSMKLNDRLYQLFAAKGKLLNHSRVETEHDYNQPNATPHESSKNQKHTNDRLYEQVTRNIRAEVYGEFQALSEIIDNVKSADSDGEISELTSTFYTSLKKDLLPRYKLTNAKATSFSYANIYTWITYTLADILIDTKNEYSLIPVLTILGRKTIGQYLKAGVELSTVNKLFDYVDHANATELLLRKDVGIDLSSNTIWIRNINTSKAKKIMPEKSLAHTIGPLAVTNSLQCDYNSKVETAMRLYCSSRQLNDDLHDWIEDMSNGQVTYVIYLLLKRCGVKPGKYNFSVLLDTMKSTYWNCVLEECCIKIQKDISEAVSILEDNILEKNSEFCLKYLEPISTSALKALESHQFNKRFVNAIRH